MECILIIFSLHYSLTSSRSHPSLSSLSYQFCIPPFPFFLTLILMHIFLFMLPIFSFIKDHPFSGAWATCHGLHSYKKSFSPTEAAHSSSVQDGNSQTASHPMVEGWLIWYADTVVQANSAALSSWVNSLVMPRRIFHRSLSHSLALTMILHSVTVAPEPREMGWDKCSICDWSFHCNLCSH